jgi:ribonuclease HI
LDLLLRHELIGLVSALNWIHELNLSPIGFNLDSKPVVDNFLSNRKDLTEFFDIINNYKIVISSLYVNSSLVSNQ